MERVRNLAEYVQGLMENKNGRELYIRYRDDLEGVTPQEAFEVFTLLLNKGKQADDILVVLDKVINVFYKSLSRYSWKKPAKNSFIGVLMEENNGLVKRLDYIKGILKEKNISTHKKELIAAVSELKQFNAHYLKKENILFPYMEKKNSRFEGLSIMWALHDITRDLIKEVIKILESGAYNEEDFNKAIGSLFFAMHGLVQKEELILFPAAMEVIDDNEWPEMMRQSEEYGFPFIDYPMQTENKPDIPENKIENKSENTAGNNSVNLKDSTSPKTGFAIETETGRLSLEQVLMIFDTLPVDVTLVDENNKVVFFNRPKDRLFPRSPAVIGRDVRNCHPPKSLHIVNEIIESFRNGRQDNATFWIELKGRMILIKYFALRDSEGRFRGTLEVSQDITDIKKLEGERRLLQWENR